MLPHVRREIVEANIASGVIDTVVDDNHPWFAGLVEGDRAGEINDLLLNNYETGHATFIA